MMREMYMNKDWRETIDRVEQIETAREKGIKEGIKEGGKKKAVEIAKNLLDVLDSETIAIKTGLTIDEINKLGERNL